MSESTESPRLRIYLLGGFQVSADIRPIPDAAWRRRKAAALVKLLALSPGRRLHREQLLDILWSELEPEAGNRNLHHTLHVARHILGPRGSVLRLNQEHVYFQPSELPWVDVEAFETQAARARNSHRPPVYQVALATYAGDLLPDDLYEDWTLDRRAGLRTLALALSLELASELMQRNDIDGAIKALQRALELDSACEEAHAELMRIYSRSGQRHQALRQYDRMRKSLQSELDVEPSEATRALYEQIRAGTSAPAPAPAAPRLPSASEARHNLVAPVTSFIGREQEVREIQRHLSVTRLVTLIGIGGSGKMRLALEAAEPILDRYEDGIWLVELDSIVDPALVPEAIARTLGVTAEPEQRIETALLERLRERRSLVALVALHQGGEALLRCASRPRPTTQSLGGGASGAVPIPRWAQSRALCACACARMACTSGRRCA